MPGREAILRTPIIVALIALVPSCGRDKPSAPRPGAPIACFTMKSELESDANCLFQLMFVLDASCSTDDLTSSTDLQVRWDYENDGTWDTDFSTIKVDDTFKPDPTRSTWAARCQVRDSDGTLSESTRSLTLGPYPTSPDLVAGAIRFRVGSGAGVDTETVHVNEEFSIIVFETCYGDFPDFETRLLRNGAPVDSTAGGCTGGLFGCGGRGHGGWMIASPGTYEFTAILDSDGANSETNETNNTARATLVVIP